MAAFSSTVLAVFTGYTQNFLYGLCQQKTAQPSISNDTNWNANESYVELQKDNALQCQIYNDQFNAQASLDRAWYYIQNQAYFF